MKVLQYSPDNKASIISEALVTLLSGGVIVYPTETAYAIGADFFSPAAYRRIFTIKKRNGGKVLPVIVPTLQYATTLVRFSSQAMRLASTYWPGPLTLVLPFMYRGGMPHHQDNFLALRVSSHPIASALDRAFGRPLISTSANISGDSSMYSAQEIADRFDGERAAPDLIIDAGVLPRVKPSTIIKDDGANLTVLRQGPLTIPISHATR